MLPSLYSRAELLQSAIEDAEDLVRITSFSQSFQYSRTRGILTTR